MATDAEQQQFQKRNKERQPIRKQLLQKKAEYEEAVKLAMGRTLLS
jgi:hypothetical protein